MTGNWNSAIQCYPKSELFKKVKYLPPFMHIACMPVGQSLHVSFIISGIEKAPVQSKTQEHSNATYSLLLPGKVLDLHVLSSLRKYKGRGNKPGAIKAYLPWHLSPAI